MPEFTADFFAHHGLKVSRETLEMFGVYAGLLRKWQNTINLVGAETLETLAVRHFLDSVQLVKYLPEGPLKLADMGAGAGFPGLVLAMMGVGEVHLIESDVRKATFLREVSRETFFKDADCSARTHCAPYFSASGRGARNRDWRMPVTVHDERVEDVEIEGLDIIMARALAPLKDLLSLSLRLAAGNDVKCLFLKGEKYQDELEKAKKRFDFKLQIHDSLSDPAGKILEISGLAPR